jgi:hypothetical protein
VTAPTPDGGTALVGVELANLRGSFDRFGRDLGDVKTSVAVLVERSTHVDQAVRQLRVDTTREIEETRGELATVRSQVDSLRQWRWVVTGAAAAVGTAAGFAAQFIAH